MSLKKYNCEAQGFPKEELCLMMSYHLMELTILSGRQKLARKERFAAVTY